MKKAIATIESLQKLYIKNYLPDFLFEVLYEEKIKDNIVLDSETKTYSLNGVRYIIKLLRDHSIDVTDIGTYIKRIESEDINIETRNNLIFGLLIIEEYTSKNPALIDTNKANFAIDFYNSNMVMLTNNNLIQAVDFNKDKHTTNPFYSLDDLYEVVFDIIKGGKDPFGMYNNISYCNDMEKCCSIYDSVLYYHILYGCSIVPGDVLIVGVKKVGIILSALDMLNYPYKIEKLDSDNKMVTISYYTNLEGGNE